MNIHNKNIGKILFLAPHRTSACTAKKPFLTGVMLFTLFVCAPLTAQDTKELKQLAELKSVFSIVVSEVIKKEFTRESVPILNRLLKTHSLEELMKLAEQSHPEAQKTIFFLYYLAKIKRIDVFPIENGGQIIINDHFMQRAEALIQQTSGASALFLRGLYLFTQGDVQESTRLLKQAGATGHGLSRLSLLIINIMENSVTAEPADKILIHEKTIFAEIHQNLNAVKNAHRDLPGLNFLTGILLYLKQEDEKAIKRFFTVIKNNNFHDFTTASYAYIGMIHHRNKRYSLAKKHLITAIKRGNDTSKPYLLDIYVNEGNHSETIKLLEEIATQWGKYRGIASIKASFLLSYMLERGMGAVEDLIQAYIWAERINKIYLINQTFDIQKTLNPQTGRYMVDPGLYTLLFTYKHTEEQQEKQLEKQQESTSGTTHHLQAKNNLPNLFELMDLYNRRSPFLTAEQRQITIDYIKRLEQKLNARQELTRARDIAKSAFEQLHLLAPCPSAFSPRTH